MGFQVVPFFACLLTTLDAADRTFTFENRCSTDIWIGASGNPTPAGGGFRLPANTNKSVTVAGNTCCARMWAETGCTFASNGSLLSCKTCNKAYQCTLFEFTLGTTDFYDISLVDAFNAAMNVTTDSKDKNGFHCGDIVCQFEWKDCPAELTIKNSDGSYKTCISSCGAINNATQVAMYPILQTNKQGIYTCCNKPPGPGCNSANDPDKWPISSNGLDYYQVFKKYCPTSYIYPYDDGASTFTCNEPVNYQMIVDYCET
jgi:hypothetical protein